MPHPKTSRPRLFSMAGGYRAEIKANAESHLGRAKAGLRPDCCAKYPNTLIHTSGPFVGTARGAEMGQQRKSGI